MAGNQTQVMQQKNGQKILTLPSVIAGAMRLNKGDKVEWIIDRGDVIVRKV